MEKDFINNIVIFDGQKEYTSLEIINSKELYSFLNRYLIIFPAEFMQKIILENGILYISTNKTFSEATFEPRNVSIELREEFRKIYDH